MLSPTDCSVLLTPPLWPSMKKTLPRSSTQTLRMCPPSARRTQTLPMLPGPTPDMNSVIRAAVDRRKPVGAPCLMADATA